MYIVLMGTHYQWRYPTPGDSVEHEQLLSVKPTGDWATSSSRNMTFKLTSGSGTITAVYMPCVDVNTVNLCHIHVD